MSGWLNKVRRITSYAGLGLALVIPTGPAPAAVLEFLEFHQDGLGGVNGLDAARGVAVSPDGASVYVASGFDHAVAVFSRDISSGELGFVEVQRDGAAGVDGLNLAASVAVSPDGAHVYVAGSGEDAIAVFGRNGLTGALSFVEFQQDGVGGVDGLDLDRSVTVSPDGRHVYATGQLDNAVAVFSRNQTSGALTFVELEQDGVGGVGGLGGPRGVTVSPDGAHVYIASVFDSAVAVFSRNQTTGALTFVEFEQNGVAGVEGIFGASSAVVSPDGGYAIVTGSDDDAIAVFERDRGTGALDFVEVHQDGLAGVDGLGGAFWAAVSPDGTNVYVASDVDDELAVFIPEPSPPPRSLCIADVGTAAEESTARQGDDIRALLIARAGLASSGTWTAKKSRIPPMAGATRASHAPTGSRSPRLATVTCCAAARRSRPTADPVRG
jgi:6-phosphogluconolactonase (cycloisomerase 2 family)